MLGSRVRCVSGLGKMRWVDGKVSDPSEATGALIAGDLVRVTGGE